MTRLRHAVSRTGRLWLALLALLTLLQGLQPLLHAHPRGAVAEFSPVTADGTVRRFALHLPDSPVTHALSERPGPAPVTVTAESERCRSLDGCAPAPLGPPTLLSVLMPPPVIRHTPRPIQTPLPDDPVAERRSPRGPPAA